MKKDPPKPLPENPQGKRTRLFVALAVLFTLAALAIAYHFGSRYLEAKKHWETAHHALDKQDFATARKHLDACLAYWPNDAETTFVMGRTCRRWGDFVAARKHLEKAERLKWPERDVALEHLLIVVQERGPTPMEAPALDAYFMGRSKEEVLILEAMATGCFASHRIGETKKTLDYWIEHYPQDWVPYYWRGDLYHKIGNQRLAVADLKEAIRLRPDHEDVRHLLIAAYVLAGNDREALAELEVHLRARPGDAESLVNQARCQRNLNDAVAARVALEELFARHPEHTGGTLTMAMLEADTDRPQEALRWLTRFEKSAPADLNDVVAAAQLAVGLLRQLGMTKEHEERQQRLKQLLDDNAQINKAMSDLASGSNDPALYFLVGSIQLRHGLNKAAEPWLQRAVALKPNDKQAHVLLVELYRKRGDEASLRRAAYHQQRAGAKEPG